MSRRIISSLDQVAIRCSVPPSCGDYGSIFQPYSIHQYERGMQARLLGCSDSYRYCAIWIRLRSVAPFRQAAAIMAAYSSHTVSTSTNAGCKPGCSDARIATDIARYRDTIARGRQLERTDNGGGRRDRKSGVEG